MPGTTSMATPVSQFGGLGGTEVVNGNAPSVAGFDGAVLFPLGNRVLVGPTAEYEWVNSSIVKTIGAGPTQSASTNANDLNFTGEYTVNGNRVSILYQFITPTGILVDAFSGSTSVVGTGTCGGSPLSFLVTCSGEGVTNDSNGNPTTFQFTPAPEQRSAGYSHLQQRVGQLQRVAGASVLQKRPTSPMRRIRPIRSRPPTAP